MNERIRELAKEARMYADGLLGLGKPKIVWQDEFEAKFAELIVKETLQVTRAGIEFGPSMEEAVYKYFGVK